MTDTNLSSTAPGAIASTARFVWHDLTSTDPRRALEFYQALFGWTAEEMEGLRGDRYLMLRADDQQVGGIVHADRAASWPSHWMSYVSVPDVDEALERAVQLGGRVYIGGTDIRPGRMALVADPAGAELGLIRFDAAHAPAPLHHPSGTFCWDELATHDTARARNFYTQLLGWDWERTDVDKWGTYWYALQGERQVGGMLAMDAEAPGPAAWLPYVLAERVDDSAARAVSLGASLLMPPADVPDVGRFAVLQDPTGAAFALYTSPGAVQ